MGSIMLLYSIFFKCPWFENYCLLIVFALCKTQNCITSSLKYSWSSNFDMLFLGLLKYVLIRKRNSKSEQNLMEVQMHPEMKLILVWPFCFKTFLGIHLPNKTNESTNNIKTKTTHNKTIWMFNGKYCDYFNYNIFINIWVTFITTAHRQDALKQCSKLRGESVVFPAAVSSRPVRPNYCPSGISGKLY